jgi:hypothetical protein
MFKAFDVSKVICARCGKLVERITHLYPCVGLTLNLKVECHGEIEIATITAHQFLEGRVTIGRAFESPGLSMESGRLGGLSDA